MATNKSNRFARRKDNGCRAACSVRGLLLAGLIAGAGYWIWGHWLAPTAGEAGRDDTTTERPVSAPPLQGPAQALDPRIKSIVGKMFEEWKRRYISTERKQHGVGVRDMSELLVDLKNERLYTDRALRSEIDRALRALGVPADQCAEVAESILKEAKLDGQKQQKGGSVGMRPKTSDETNP